MQNTIKRERERGGDREKKMKKKWSKQMTYYTNEWINLDLPQWKKKNESRRDDEIVDVK